MEKYVDDVLLVCSMAKRGDRIVQGKLERSCEAFSKDQKEKIKREDLTLSLLQEVADSYLPFLKFTGEVAHGEQGIPVLDTSMHYGSLKTPGHLFKAEPGYTPPGEESGGEEEEAGKKGIVYHFFKKSLRNPWPVGLES